METNTDNVNTTSRRDAQTKTSSSTQTEPKTQNTDTQTELSIETKEIYYKNQTWKSRKATHCAGKIYKRWDSATLPAIRNDKSMRPLVNFVKGSETRKSLKKSRSVSVLVQYTTIYDRIILPNQLRQTVLDSLHLTNPKSAAMLDPCQHIRFPHIH